MLLSRRLSQRVIRASLSLGTLALLVSSGFAATPQAVNLGPEDQSKPISVTVWLHPHNKATLDSMVQDMYDKSSPSYHRFLTLKEFNKQFAPTAKDAATVRDFLNSSQSNSDGSTSSHRVRAPRPRGLRRCSQSP